MFDNPNFKIRYIKCGSSARFWKGAKKNGYLPAGFAEIPHDIALSGDLELIQQALISAGKNPRGANRMAKECWEFYQLPEGTIFVTFADGHLWWAEAVIETTLTGGDGITTPYRIRKTKNGWSNCDANGVPLLSEHLGTRITKTASYQQTICSFGADEEAILKRHLSGRKDTEIIDFNIAQSSNRMALAKILRRLSAKDMEELTSMIFERAGWRRISRLGGIEADIDLLAQDPLFGTRAWVQVKTRASQAILQDYLARFQAHNTSERFVFVCSDPEGKLTLGDCDSDRYEVWSGEVLAQHVENAGLSNWVCDRV